MGEGEAGCVLREVQQSLEEEVLACGFAVGSRLESPCVSEKRRLLGFNGTWLFSLLDKL